MLPLRAPQVEKIKGKVEKMEGKVDIEKIERRVEKKMEGKVEKMEGIVVKILSLNFTRAKPGKSASESI